MSSLDSEERIKKTLKLLLEQKMDFTHVFEEMLNEFAEDLDQLVEGYLDDYKYKEYEAEASCDLSMCDSHNNDDDMRLGIRDVC
jgi:hypothetical protein